MDKTLILLTNYFPYYKGEEYLETEIYYLSKMYRNIYIFPVMSNSSMKTPTRKVPNNVFVYNLSIDARKTTMTVLNSNKVIKNKKIMESIKNDSNKLLDMIFTIYFECRSIYVYEKILEILIRDDLDFCEHISIYSYWLFVTANVGIKLKEDYFKNYDVKLVSRAHGYDVNESANLINFLPYRKKFINEIDYIYPVSNKGKDNLLRHNDTADNIIIDYLGVKNDINSNSSFFPNEQLILLSCSTVRKLKRLDLVIDSLSILASKGIKFKWVHVGSGSELKHIKKRANNLLPIESFEFKGYMSNKEVMNFYKRNKFSFFINTSTSEGLPVSIMEAMSFSIPVIATDVGGTSEILINEKNGYLISKDISKENLARILINCKSINIQEYNNLAQQAYNTWEQSFNSDINYTSFTRRLHDE